MIDPRKMIASEDRDTGGVLSAIKSATVLGVAAFGGIRLTNNYTQMHRFVNKTIQQHKAELESKTKQISLLYDELDGNLAPSDREEVLKYMFSEGKVAATEGIPVHDHLTGGVKERALYNIEEDFMDMNANWAQEEIREYRVEFLSGDEAYHTNLTDINAKLDEYNKPLVSKALSIIREKDSFAGRAIEERYPGFLGFMNDIPDTTWGAKPGLHGWHVWITDDIGKTADFFLPDHTTGSITVRGNQYRYTPRVTIPGDVTGIAESFAFGETVMRQANRSIEGYLAAYKDRLDSIIDGVGTKESAAMRKRINKILKDGVIRTTGGPIMSDSTAEIIKMLFERTIASHTDEFMGDVHPASTLIKRFVLPELEAAAEKSHLQESQTSIATTLQNLTNKKRIEKTIYGPGKGWTGSTDIFVPGTSEAATVKGKISTKSPFWITPFMDYGKQSQQRIDWMRGKAIKGSSLDFSEIKAYLEPDELVKRMHVKLAALLGPAPVDVVKQLSEITGETLPGRLANVGFWFDTWNEAPMGELSRQGDGAVTFVAREGTTLMGKSTLNIEEFAGTMPKKYSMLSTVTDGDGAYTSVKIKETLDLIDSEIRKHGVAELKAGETIGFDPVTHEKVKLTEDSIVMHFEHKDGELDMFVREKRPLTTGQKVTFTKAQITKIIHQEELESKVGGKLGKYIAAGDAKTGIELLYSADALSKFKGGALGLGITQKVLSDMALVERNKFIEVMKSKGKLEAETGVKIGEIDKVREKVSKKLESIAKVMLGDEAMTKGIKNITIDDDFNVAVFLKEGILTDDAMFFKLTDVEKLIEKGDLYGDWTGLAEWSKNLERNINKVDKTYKYKVMDYANQLNMEMAGKGPSPVFIMASRGAYEGLALINAKAPSFLHKASAYQSFKVATRHRTPIGYAGGFKSTIDHIRNASIMGLEHYNRYLQILRDYNLPYIQNKYTAAEAKPLMNLSMHKKGPMTIPTDSGPSFRMKTKQLILGEDMVSALAKDYADIESLHGLIKFKVAEQNSANLIGEIGNDRLQEALLSGEFMDLDDLASRGKLGLRGNSLGLTDKETMKRVMSMVNSRAKDEIVYLKLPMDVALDGGMARYVPLHDFNMGDMFELTALSRDGQMRASYFTGNEMYQNQIRFLREVADVDFRMRQSKKDQFTMDSFKKQLEVAHHRYVTNLRNAFTGKNSPLKQKLTEFRLPVSANGQLRDIEEHMLAAIAAQNKSGRGTVASVAMHRDDLAKMFTMGEVQSFGELKHLADLSNWFDEYGEAFKSMDSIIQDTNMKIGNWGAKERSNVLKAIEPGWKAPKMTQGGPLQRALQELDNILKVDKEGKYTSLLKYFDTDQIGEIFPENVDTENIWRSIIDELKGSQGEIDKRMVIRRRMKSYKSIVRRIGDNRGEKYGRALAAYNLINDISDGVVDFKARVQGYPELSLSSGAFVSIVPVDDKGISEKLQAAIKERYGTKKGGKILESMFENMKGRIMLPRLLYESIARDVDGDVVGLIGISLNELDKAWEHAKVTKDLMKELGYSKKFSRQMAVEAIDSLVYQQTVIESSIMEATGEYRPIRPTNSKALTMAAQADEMAKKGLLEKTELREYLQKNVHDDLVRAGLSESEASKHIDDLVTNVNRMTKEMYLDKEKGIAYVITGIKDNRTADQRAAEMSKEVAKNRKARAKVMSEVSHISPLDKESLQVIAKDYPEELQRLLGQSLSDDQNVILSHLRRIEKQGWEDYQLYFRRRSVATFAERKLKTPSAYITGEAISYLSEAYAKDERYKSMLAILADKNLTQHALNMKHGKPLILKDMVDRLKYMAEPDSRNAKEYFKEHYGTTMATEEFYKDFAKGNFIIELPDGTLKDMKEAGFIKHSTEKVNFETYEKYIAARQEYLGALSEANSQSIKSLGDEYASNKKITSEIKSRHRQNIDAKMRSWKSTVAPDDFKMTLPQNEWMYHGAIVSGAKEENLQMLQNLRKWKVEETMSKFLPDVEDRVDLLKRYSRDARSWETIEGMGLFQDEAIKVLRRYKPVEGESLRNVAVATVNRLDEWVRSGRKGPVAIDNLARRIIGRAAMFVHEVFPDIATMDVERRKTAYMQGAAQENKRILGDKLYRAARGSTPYREGSIFDAIAGKINRLGASAMDDTALRSIRKTKVGAVIAGLFVGALAGQTFNQINSGYAVPDLEQTKGIGGEYFERTSGIMGSEMEIMMSPRAPRVTPNYRDDMRNDQAMEIMRNVSAASNRSHRVKSYGSNFKGAIVR